ncbi:P-loop containing nucleoside triphosphate hydrolase protein [Gigaspora margarita]|uniref:P-loop containing nucleoside triphosphate hydrolase protein n=1 Tax=Gigaspora margarita TaxID=4874 RepID=A0A8H3X9K6_GIGMA|nr:P-loop containing nucleoside triphosphate hydrolase protein [Gigaspora margarita]
MIPNKEWPNSAKLRKAFGLPAPKQPVNKILQNTQQVLLYEKLELDIHGCTRSRLYFAKVDVQRCFESIDQEQVLEIIKGVLEEKLGRNKPMTLIVGVRYIPIPQIKQIAGRAGRFGTENAVGEVTALETRIYNIICGSLGKIEDLARIDGLLCCIVKESLKNRLYSRKSTHNDELFGYIESIHRTLMLYLWLSYKFFRGIFRYRVGS